MKSFKGIGLIFGSLSGIGFASVNLFYKLCANYVDLFFALYVLASTLVYVLLIVMIIKKIDFWQYSWKTNVKMFILSCLTMYGSYALYLATKLIPLADVMTISSFAPVFIILIERIFFKIPFTCSSILQIIFCSVGCTLCVQPTFIFAPKYSPMSYQSLLGYMMSLSLAMYFAIFYSCLRYVKEMNRLAIMCFNYTVSCIFCSFYLIFGSGHYFYEGFTCMHSLYLVLMGLLQLVTVYFLVLGIELDGPFSVGIGRRMDIVFGLIYDYIVFGYSFGLVKVFGCILVIVSLMVPTIIDLIYKNLS